MNVDIELLKNFEDTIDTVHPEKGGVPIKILGYGEISLVFEIIGDPENLAYKRIPIFDNEEQVEKFISGYKKYCEILKEELGYNLPESDIIWFRDKKENIQLYCIQKKVIPESVCNNVIHQVTDKEVETLVLLVLKEMKKLWSYSRNNEIIDLGLDGQISNFAIIDYDVNNPKVTEDKRLWYFDTSTPFVRTNGEEAWDFELVLKSAPGFLRGILKRLYLEETVGRYYDWRKVSIDLVANFFKEKREELVPSLIVIVNNFFKKEASEFEIEPLTFEEIEDYYKDDAKMWEIFQKVRKFDRFIKTKILRKKYPFYLPGKIER
ncbi:MAG: hypothetical protein EU539_03525 [Promethearchaeota archaeon]|nr:MAG: hypothetical protein EU539_03525 [Candidatus Lokiarchaeota archaeon]